MAFKLKRFFGLSLLMFTATLITSANLAKAQPGYVPYQPPSWYDYGVLREKTIFLSPTKPSLRARWQDSLMASLLLLLLISRPSERLANVHSDNSKAHDNK
jgi:hypothetical protein